MDLSQASRKFFRVRILSKRHPVLLIRSLCDGEEESLSVALVFSLADAVDFFQFDDAGGLAARDIGQFSVREDRVDGTPSDSATDLRRSRRRLNRAKSPSESRSL
jgi:hypothetical protein